MRRFPLLAFGTLVVATVAAFFITQHLKVTTPLIAGFPAPYPSAINPESGVSCYDPVTRKYVGHRFMTISFYLLHQSDNVDVWIVDPSGRVVGTLASGRFMSGGSHPVRSKFTWDGREQSGGVAPDGTYYIKVHLIHQGRTVTISNNSGPLPVTVKTVPPQPIITDVSPSTTSAAHLVPIRIHYAGNETRAATVLIYYLGGRRGPVLVKTFLTSGRVQSTTWNGLINKLPAAPGRYLIGLQVTDAACNTGRFPVSLSPLPAAAAGTEVTVTQ